MGGKKGKEKALVLEKKKESEWQRNVSYADSRNYIFSIPSGNILKPESYRTARNYGEKYCPLRLSLSAAPPLLPPVGLTLSLSLSRGSFALSRVASVTCKNDIKRKKKRERRREWERAARRIILIKIKP
jgi:hypothetical protein